MLNPASPLPLYHQLAELLGEQIRRGELEPGARLPSEPELSRAHRIGRPTVRQATELLVRKGLIERRRGSGTYVKAGPPQAADLLSLAGTLSSLEKVGLQFETRLLRRVSKAEVPGDEGSNPFRGRDAFFFARLSRVDGAPVLLERVFLDVDTFPDLARLPLAGQSLSRLLEERYFLKPTHAEQSFRVIFPSPEVRRPLELKKRDPLLLVERTLHFPAAPSAIFAELHCRTDRLTFTQTLRDPSS